MKYGDFGDLMLALPLRTTRVTGTIRLASPRALVRVPAENLKFAKWSKLEMMQCLLKMTGWHAPLQI